MYSFSDRIFLKNWKFQIKMWFLRTKVGWNVDLCREVNVNFTIQFVKRSVSGYNPSSFRIG